MRIFVFGSSLTSSYWNGAATYYRGLIRAMSERGHQITFYEPDAFARLLAQERHGGPRQRGRKAALAVRRVDANAEDVAEPHSVNDAGIAVGEQPGCRQLA